jgi:hypothetical protein
MQRALWLLYYGTHLVSIPPALGLLLRDNTTVCPGCSSILLRGFTLRLILLRLAFQNSRGRRIHAVRTSTAPVVHHGLLLLGCGGCHCTATAVGAAGQSSRSLVKRCRRVSAGAQQLRLAREPVALLCKNHTQEIHQVNRSHAVPTRNERLTHRRPSRHRWRSAWSGCYATPPPRSAGPARWHRWWLPLWPQRAACSCCGCCCSRFRRLCLRSGGCWSCETCWTATAQRLPPAA